MPFTKTHTIVIKCLAVLCFLGISFFGKAQVIANYVTNGGFELLNDDCKNKPHEITLALGWRPIDSVYTGIVEYNNYCLYNVPYGGTTSLFQYPFKGKGFASTTFYCPPPYCVSYANRFYFRNRLKQKLQSGRIYCVKFYYVVSNASSYGISDIAAYFGDDMLDTIKKRPWVPLTYLNPQIKNAHGHYATDTLNWTALTGTFTAQGNEKHVVIGNFTANNLVDSILINPSLLPNSGTDICIDHVSCIPIDLPAYAGPDKSCIVGDSVFIGRAPDVEIDESCVWYKLNSNGSLSNPIDTVAGMYVKPITTTTFVVRQQLWCSGVKWDTVVVYQDFVGLPSVVLDSARTDIWVYPNPAQNQIYIQTTQSSWFGANSRLSIYNHLGALMKESNIVLNNKSLIYTIDDLNEGVYTLLFRNPDGAYLTKRLLISRK